MKVILMDNVRALGKVGDIKDVRDGFARNFLLPRSLARAATAGSVKDVEQFKAKKLAVFDLAQKEAQMVADKLADVVVELTAQANEKGTLFAAIEPDEIALKLSELAGAKISAADIVLSAPIKTVGEHQAVIDLADEISVEVKVKVSRTQ